MFGYMGKLLFTDLTSGSISEETPSESIYRQCIGGEGLGVRMLCERQAGGADALGPENILGFVTGLLTGCSVPMASRLVVVTKSPLTGTWGDANVGGFFGQELKASGYDAIFFKGVSPHPVYLVITENKAELRDASHLWGKDTVETGEILRQEIGDPGIRVACIGPVGEAQSLLASTIMDGRVAARSGVGAVMGAKNLKAIVVRGKKKVAVADSEAIKVIKSNIIKEIKESNNPFIKMLLGPGTSGGLSMMVAIGDSPIKNWSLAGEEAMPEYVKLDGGNINKYQIKKAGCAGCPIVCGGIINVSEGPYQVTEARKPEYETLVAFGTLCFNGNAESVIKCNDICDRYGMDTMSAGATIAFAIECYERGIISKQDTEGIELTWGNATAIVSVLTKMAKREGFGAVLADGVKRAAERIGRGAEEYAVHVHGQEVPYHDPRMFPNTGTMCISDPTPSRHTRWGASAVLEGGGSLAPYPELQVPAVDLTDYQAKGQIYALDTKYREAFVSCGMCSFAGNLGSLSLVDLISSATGWDFTISELLVSGERIQTLRQAFNVREGLRPQDFCLPPKLQKPASFGLLKGVSVDFEALRRMYYSAMNWDTETGEPSKERLQELGIGQVIK